MLRGKRTSSPVNFASEVLVLGFGILTVTQNNCRKRHLRECSVVENFLSQKLQSLPNNISEEKIQFYTEKIIFPYYYTSMHTKCSLRILKKENIIILKGSCLRQFLCIPSSHGLEEVK